MTRPHHDLPTVLHYSSAAAEQYCLVYLLLVKELTKQETRGKRCNARSGRLSSQQPEATTKDHVVATGKKQQRPASAATQSALSGLLRRTSSSTASWSCGCRQHEQRQSLERHGRQFEQSSQRRQWCCCWLLQCRCFFALSCQQRQRQ